MAPSGDASGNLALPLPDVSTDGRDYPLDTDIPVPPQIDGYRNFSYVGRGGMGIVWRATQIATRRVVAVKVLNENIACDRARQRFEREVRLTARLNTPHIASIYDSGTNRGVYYYAMEYIDGLPIDQHVKQQQLCERDILLLVKKVCLAIQHAHHKSVIHRDIKPSNILVRPDGEPCVLDFGLAQLTDDLAERTSVSLYGEVFGTLAYMSPEQARGNSQEVDARTDVYSLGVLLYRLLTNAFPHDMSGGIPAVTRRIAEEEPTHPRTYAKTMDRDLARLLLKAIASEPAERYVAPASLASDIQQYLDGEPLAAQPATVIYFLGKRIRKYRGRITLATAIIVLLLGAVGLSVFNVVIERNRANAASAVAVAQRERAEQFANTSRDRLVRLHVTRGMEWLHRNDPVSSLPWLVAAMQLDQPGSAAERHHRLRLGMALDQLPQLQDMRFLDETPARITHRGDGSVLVISRVGNAIVIPSEDGPTLAAPATPQGVSPFMQVSPTDRMGFVPGADGTGQLWSIDRDEAVASLPHPQPVRRSRFSQDGRLLATTTDTALHLWDGFSGEPLHQIDLAADVFEMQFSANGRRLITMQVDRSQTPAMPQIQVWDVETGEPMSVPIATAIPAVHALVTADDQLVSVEASYGDQQLFITRHDMNGQPIGEQITLSVFTVAPLKDSASITYAANGNIYVMDVVTMQRRRIGRVHEDASEMTLESDATGRYVSAAWPDGTFRVWDVDAAVALTTPLKHESNVQRWTVDPVRQRLITVTREGVVRVWNYQPRESIRFDYDGAVVAWAQDATGRQLFIGSNMGQVWRTDTGEAITPPLMPDLQCRAGTFSPDGRLLATAHDDETVRLWQLPGGVPGPVFRLASEGPISITLAFSPDGKLLLATGQSGVHIWDLAREAAAMPTLAHAQVNHAAFSPDGTTIATLSATDEARPGVRLWDAATGDALGERLAFEDGRAVTFTDDAQHVVAVDAHGRLRAWALRTGEPATLDDTRLPKLTPDDGRWSMEGDVIARAVLDGVVVQSATDPLAQRAMLSAGIRPKVDVSLVNDLIATVDNSGKAGLWSASTGSAVMAWSTEPWPRAMAISRDGRHLIIAGRDHATLHRLTLSHDGEDALQDLSLLWRSRRMSEDHTLEAVSPAELREAWGRQNGRRSP